MELNNNLIHKIENELIKFEKEWGVVNFVRPNNLKKEKAKFFNKKYKYNPQFSYNKTSEISYTQLQELGQKLKSTDIEILYQKKIQEIETKHKFIESIGDAALLTHYSDILFGKPTKACAEAALRIVSLGKIQTKASSYNLRAKEIAERMKHYLKQNNLNFEIEITNKPAIENSISIKKVTYKIQISKNYIADEDEYKDMVAHEIDTHLRRINNGSKQEYKIFVIGTADYLRTEEGLAPIMGHLVKQDQRLTHPSLLLLSIYKSLDSNFSEVFEYLLDILKDPFRAWYYTMRSKRGISDTSQPGAFTKDLYLEWVIDVGRELIAIPENLNYAFNGKASLNELKQFTAPIAVDDKITIDKIKNLFDINQINYENK